MTPQEIQERNKQVALMLGWSYIKDGDSWVADLSNQVFYTGNKLIFQLDWNWLMQAVEFIESKMLYSIKINSSPTISSRWLSHTIQIQNANFVDIASNTFIIKYQSDYSQGQTKIEAVFIAVSDFAKLYNDKKL